jgi:mannose-6-phosphate isomerase-like protein (cupin superfamily)
MDEQIWKPELDALVAAPEHHRLLLENEFVRVLDTLILPGQKTALHTHQFPSTLYVMSWSECIRYDQDNKILFDSANAGFVPAEGFVLWSGPLAAHSLENVGKKDLHIISVELKSRLEDRMKNPSL